jgi:hypothetical protein
MSKSTVPPPDSDEPVAADSALARNPAAPTPATPAQLPESLRAGLDSPHPSIRIGAVTALAVSRR